jgi:hypothetical protein
VRERHLDLGALGIAAKGFHLNLDFCFNGRLNRQEPARQGLQPIGFPGRTDLKSDGVEVQRLGVGDADGDGQAVGFARPDLHVPLEQVGVELDFSVAAGDPLDLRAGRTRRRPF